MAAYDDFAWFYNRYWNEEFHSLTFPILERIWLPRLPGGANVLDVCCGTGYLAGLLTSRGYHVTGIDASSSMVAYARENVPEAVFQVADASQFHLDAQFDGAISTFDSLNHIVTLPELQATFGNTAAALKRGSSLAFDILLEEAYQTHWGEAFSLVRDDHVLTITGAGYDFRSRMARCTITMFRLLEGQWQRSDVEIRERSYTVREIDGALRAAGFGEIHCYDARDLGMASELGTGRIFYVASRR